jgi:hypothetical protein
MIYVNSKADEGTENLEISPADDDYLEIFPDGEDSELYLKAHYKKGSLSLLIQMPGDVLLYDAAKEPPME